MPRVGLNPVSTTPVSSDESSSSSSSTTPRSLASETAGLAHDLFDGLVGGSLRAVAHGAHRLGDALGAPRLGDAVGAVVGTLAPGVIASSHPEAINGVKLLDFKADKKTWHCHWFPMRATEPYDDDLEPGERDYDELKAGGNHINNLYAKGGALDKYNQAFGLSGRKSARAQEVLASGHYVAAEDKDKGWWGHCNNASEVACMLEQPQYDVTYRGVTFTPNDVAGLLCRISRCLTSGTDFMGDRYNRPGDDANDPNPAKFLAAMLKWSKDGKPFVLDVDRLTQVWNYPYDSVEITEYNGIPVINGVKIDASEVPSGGQVKFYRFQLSGTGFPQQERDIVGFIHTDDEGKVTAKWVKCGNADERFINPDFAWRPHYKYDNGEKWEGRAEGNPYVSAAKVQEIYERSLREPSTLSDAWYWLTGR